jgi:hypothetical protein
MTKHQREHAYGGPGRARRGQVPVRPDTSHRPWTAARYWKVYWVVVLTALGGRSRVQDRNPRSASNGTTRGRPVSQRGRNPAAYLVVDLLEHHLDRHADARVLVRAADEVGVQADASRFGEYPCCFVPRKSMRGAWACARL